jgi:RNA polymerase-binding transcription factor DksA
MSIVQEGYPLLRSHSGQPEISRLHPQLQSALTAWLRQASSRASFGLSELEQALDHRRPVSSGACRECRNDIPLSRLRREPEAMLCLACIEERLELLAADAL